MNTPISRSFRPAPKVVSIPVHFVGSTSSIKSTSATLSTSATRIQKVFRGFLVRKSIKEILAIGSDVDRAERRVLDGLDSIRNDPKERLKANETLMGLLFKLDSVRAPSPGIRDCRKAVIKKAIVLQEIIDGCDESRADVANKIVGIEDGVEEAIGLEGKIDGCDLSGADVADDDMMIEGGDDDRSESMKCDKLVDFVKECDELQERIDGCDASGADVADEDMVEGGEDKLVGLEAEKEEEDYCFVKQVVVGEKEYNDAKQIENECFDDEFKSEKSSDKEILERMMEENGKMMGLMKQLSEQNQVQTQMLTMLSQRVEHLEKAFVYEILRKKNKDKKKRMENGVTDGFDFCPDQKKCGEKR